MTPPETQTANENSMEESFNGTAAPPEDFQDPRRLRRWRSTRAWADSAPV